ncbi:MAG: nucleotide exchange factor GrpE [Deltaproteobacteria bacterium]|jgi:molecular chaperone GrpE|nr:nucleotide exchange factor GrpE [Deltaproteobacteria bacterium]
MAEGDYRAGFGLEGESEPEGFGEANSENSRHEEDLGDEGPLGPFERDPLAEEARRAGLMVEDEPGHDEVLTDWEAEAKRLQDLYLRTLAEAENTRRRFQKEKEETSRYASEGVLRDLLPFLDNLNLALAYADTENPAVKSLAEGVAMTLKGCLDKMADWGLKEVAVTIGSPFDPNFQEAIGQIPDPALPDKSVGRLVAKGYALHGRLLRPARVMVVRNQD